MKPNPFIFILSLAMFVLRFSHSQAQCTSTEIEVAGTPYIYHNTAGSANAWQVIPIDDNNDGDIIKDDGYVAVGFTATSTHMQQAIVVRLTSSLAVYSGWGTAKLFGGTNNDVAYSVDQTSDNNLIVCGTKVPAFPAAEGVKMSGYSK
jgi:hypothetical protein